MIEDYCGIVKRGKADAEDFESFLHHIGECTDCQRRISSQIIVKFKQRTEER
jgi:hypothetical protein